MDASHLHLAQQVENTVALFLESLDRISQIDCKDEIKEKSIVALLTSFIERFNGPKEFWNITYRLTEEAFLEIIDRGYSGPPCIIAYDGPDQDKIFSLFERKTEISGNPYYFDHDHYNIPGMIVNIKKGYNFIGGTIEESYMVGYIATAYPEGQETFGMLFDFIVSYFESNLDFSIKKIPYGRYEYGIFPV